MIDGQDFFNTLEFINLHLIAFNASLYYILFDF